MAALCLLLLLFLFNLNSCDDFSDTLCDRIECEPIHCDGIRIEKVVGPGKCCPGCIKFEYDLDVKSKCIPKTKWKSQFDVSPYITLRDCKMGLKCSNQKCVEIKDNCFERLKNNLVISADQWLPNCDRNGDYEGRQCDKDVCFCADKGLKRIFGRSDFFDADNMTCVCSRKAKEFKDGHYSCQRNGDFAPIQCLTTHCFCVNTATGEITSQILPKPLVSFLPCYTEELFLQYFGSACIMELNSKQPLIDYFKNIGLKDNLQNTVSCDPDGTYSPVQTDGQKKWCALPNGESSSEGILASNALGIKMDCLCNRENWELKQEGRPDSLLCRNNGNYESLGFSKDGKNCFCVENGFQVTTAIEVEVLEDNVCNTDYTWTKEERRTVICYSEYYKPCGM